MAIIYKVPGPCNISWDGNDLGRTKAGIRLRCRMGRVPITDDEHGLAPADFILSGKSMVVETILLNMTLLAAGDPYIYKLLQDRLTAGQTEGYVGRTLFSGEQDDTDDLGKELIITDRWEKVWKAKQTVPTAPSQILLRSTQENQLPIAFRCVPDEDLKIFYALPDYM